MIPFSHSLRSQFFLRLVLPWLSFGFSLVAQINSIQSPTNVVFSSGRTYLVEKKLELIDSVRFEPGTVIKFRPGAGLKISPSTRIDWEARPTAPIIFTADDDDSAGDPIPGSTGRPAERPETETALEVNLSNRITPLRFDNLQIRYLGCALALNNASAGISLWHLQIAHCAVGIRSSQSSVHLRNTLILQTGAHFSDLNRSKVDVQQATFAGGRTLNQRPVESDLSILRSLFIDLGDRTGFRSINCESPSNLPLPGALTNTFQLANETAYLPPNSRRLRGGYCHELVDPELLTVLGTMTLLAPEPLPALLAKSLYLARRPIRDLEMPDLMFGTRVRLGFHHWPKDYTTRGTTLSNAVLTLAPDVVIEGLSNHLRLLGRAQLKLDVPPKSRPPRLDGPGDSDGDGISDFREMTVGTDPNSPASRTPETLTLLGFDSPDFATEAGCLPLLGGTALRVDSFDRTAIAFTQSDHLLRYPLVWTNQGVVAPLILPDHGSLRLDYAPDWFHGLTNDAPDHECVLLDFGSLRISIDPTGRQLLLTRTGEDTDQIIRRPLPRSSISDRPFTGRTNWTLQVSFQASEFVFQPKSTPNYPLSTWQSRAFAVGNRLDGGNPALGRIDRLFLRNYISAAESPRDEGGFDTLSAVSETAGIRLLFERRWEGDITQKDLYAIERLDLDLPEARWQKLPIDGRSGSFLDTSAVLGRTYRYRVPLSVGQALEIAVAHDASPPIDRGRALLLVDREIAPRITEALAGYRRDLIADGWEVLQTEVDRHIDWENGDWKCQKYDALAVPENHRRLLKTKDIIRRNTEGHRDRTNVVVLIGHVTIPFSGWAAEDGHLDCKDPAGIHLGAWTADLFYGDLTPGWTDSTNHTTGCPDCERSQCAFCVLSNTAGDGRWDQNFLPREGPRQGAVIEVPISRIDFARLNNFDSELAALQSKPRDSVGIEIALLERYFDKLHRYRRGQLPFRNQAEGYAGVFTSHVEDNLRHIAPRLWSVAPLPASQFQTDLFHAGEPVRWGFHTDYSHFGVIGQPGAAKSGHSHFSRNIAWQRSGDMPRAAFLFSFGSFQAQWFSNYGEDVLRTCLAAPDSTLIVGCAIGFRPWITDRVHAGAPLHTLLTDSAERHGEVNARLVFLLGDLCLREDPIHPTGSLSVQTSVTGTQLSWTLSPDADIGYRITAADSLDAALWSPIAMPPRGSSLWRLSENRPKGTVFRIQAEGTRTNLSGRYRQWSAPVFVTLK